MTALTAEELLAWVDSTAAQWRALLRAHPEALALPCDVKEGQTVADLVQHIVEAELGFATRLCSTTGFRPEPLSERTAETLYELHDRAMEMLRTLLSRERVDWEERITFSPPGASAFTATRRTVFVHLLMHSIRHHAQLATDVRRGGVTADWGMDYLFMGRQST